MCAYIVFLTYDAMCKTYVKYYFEKRIVKSCCNEIVVSDETKLCFQFQKKILKGKKLRIAIKKITTIDILGFLINCT